MKGIFDVCARERLTEQPILIMQKDASPMTVQSNAVQDRVARFRDENTNSKVQHYSHRRGTYASLRNLKKMCFAVCRSKTLCWIIPRTG